MSYFVCAVLLYVGGSLVRYLLLQFAMSVVFSLFLPLFR